ncbi:MAG: aldehyde:ferredoxin oxidoreductase, partial [Deltaproteobacteria bacterium]|nr:aldehyde:ferredoxin oxidoreductase [Deltaproteobacteria bacterium]
MVTFGLHGRILLVDVGVKQYEIRPTSECPGNLGGKALATALLLEHCPAGADPLGPDNPVVIATGPICGSLAWGGSRYCICTKSPQTGLYAESYSGGAVPEAVEAAGFDAVVLTGASSGLTTLAVHEEGCEFLDASGMQGMETFVAEEEISRLTASFYPQGSRTGAMVVGPAAENLVRFAIVANDRWRCAGRCGVGTVLGAKKIKGLVFGGKRKRPLAEPDGLKAYAKDFLTRFKDSPGAKAYRARGTTQMVAIMNTARAFPAKYWSQGTCEHWERISGDTLHAEHEVVPHACRKCFMACGRKTTLRAGSYAGLTLEGPEYETIFAFGGLCMIESMEEIVRLNDLCDRLGLDTISAGNL